MYIIVLMHSMLFWMFIQDVPWNKQNVLLQTAEGDGEGGGAAGRGGGVGKSVVWFIMSENGST